ncbi:hypothetical protein NQZ79_g6880 [Umbelopsis isabellina]|nr:hypothetical protein NQZ79_g6880 [Umbelopsis isabellina]
MDNTSDPASSEQEIRDFLNNCELGLYADVLIAEGFDQLKSLFEIIESDLEAIGVKRGHRRLLQRAIASARGYDPNLPLPTTSHASSRSSATSSNNSRVDSRQDTISSTEEDNFSEFTRSKRKYRRHAKADKNAPVKPPSAYVMFSNQVRSELKDYNMSFTDLAKIVGDRWKSISPDEKEVYERTATKAKEEYLGALAKYEKTDEHKVAYMILRKRCSYAYGCLFQYSEQDYQQYLIDFKMKQQAAARAVGKPRKRPKTASPSSGSIADASNNSNGNNGGDTSSSSNGNSISINDRNTPTMAPSSMPSSERSGAATSDSGIFSNSNSSSNFDSFGASENTSSAGLTPRLSSTDYRHQSTPYPMHKEHAYHNPYKTHSAHISPNTSGESSESRSTSDHSQFLDPPTPNLYSGTRPYSPVISGQMNSQSPFNPVKTVETRPGVHPLTQPPPSGGGRYQKHSVVRSDPSSIDHARLPPLYNGVSHNGRRDTDSGSPTG